MNVAILLLLAVLALAIYGAFALTKSARHALSARRSLRRQEEQDEREFWEYDAKHKSIRTKFDPKNEWNEATSPPAEYLSAVKELNFQHKHMLQRRNGWTAKDLKDSEF